MREISRLKTALHEAEAVVIGAGAGLSAAAGYDYGGARFSALFGDFERVYGFHDMYEGGFYPFPSREEFWAYWSRYILCNRYCPPPKRTYETLLALVKDKDYFVITTNVDHCFIRAGFEKERLFYTQGDFGLFQCSLPCHRKTYDNEAAVREMAEKQRDRKIPHGLIPRCPVCGREMTVNLRSDDRFVEDEGWHAACERYIAFLGARKDSRILFLELGVGYNTPGIIKYPFQRMTAQNKRATYACVDPAATCPDRIASRSVLVRRDADEALSLLLQ